MALAPGDILTLAASAARTASANGTATQVLQGHWTPKAICVLLDITASATDAGDTLDVYVDVSMDNSTWINAVHFTQQAGNGSAGKYWAWLSRVGDPGTAPVAVTSDAASGAVRPYLIAKYIRARWAIADVSGDDASHTFSVTAQVF